jgi:pimeloyl-ACP methyl ester carboxylesterase
MPAVRVREEELDGRPVLVREADATSAVPVVYVHGVPTSSADWVPFLERTGGVAPDLPGFGRSGKRASDAYTMARYDGWLESFLEARGIGSFSLVVHDWGAVALQTAMRLAPRVHRLVIVNATPLLPGYAWHRIARAWRTPVVGELAMGLISRRTISLLSREANVAPGPLPGAMLDQVARDFDQGTQRAILALYRSAPPEALAAAGRGLDRLTCPALVVWGDRDPYVPARFADGYAAALGGPAEVVHLPDAGHWPWLDRPDVVDTVAGFLAA